MQILLPVAGMSISLPVLVGAGALVGFVAGMFGVGGGFLMTPILMVLGIPPTVAAASDSCQIVAAASSGTAAHLRMDHVDMKLGTLVLTGGIAGGWIGVRIVKVLRLMGSANLAITLTYVVALGSIGGYMFWRSLGTLRRGALEPRAHITVKRNRLLDRLPFQADFPRSGVRHSIVVPFIVGAVVGILAAIMGVGGGFIMIPMMVYLLEMPTHVAVGTNLFQELFTCTAVTYMQATSNFTVDIVLAIVLAVGSTIGAQMGARAGRLLRGEQLMILLAILVLGVMGKMTTALILLPSNHLRPARTYRREEVTEPSLNNRRATGGRIVPRQWYGIECLHTGQGSEPTSTLNNHAESARAGTTHAPAVGRFNEWIGRSFQVWLAGASQSVPGTEPLWADPERRRERLRRPLTYPSSFRWPEFATI